MGRTYSTNYGYTLLGKYFDLKMSKYNTT